MNHFSESHIYSLICLEMHQEKAEQYPAAKWGVGLLRDILLIQVFLSWTWPCDFGSSRTWTFDLGAHPLKANVLTRGLSCSLDKRSLAPLWTWRINSGKSRSLYSQKTVVVFLPTRNVLKVKGMVSTEACNYLLAPVNHWIRSVSDIRPCLGVKKAGSLYGTF